MQSNGQEKNTIGSSRNKSFNAFSTRSEKVLILSYFFPPSKQTAASRAFAYAKYFHENGYYPVIICRNWDCDVLRSADVSNPSGDEVRIEYHEGYEVHYMPFRGNYKDRFIRRFGMRRFVFLRKILTATELVLQNFTLSVIPFRNMYTEAAEIIKKNNIEKLIVIANPFTLFHIAYKLKKRFPRIRWVADYRDDWNTQTLNGHARPGIFRGLEARSEKKWVGSSSYVTSVSDDCTERIKRFVKKPGETISNGFFEEVYAA